MAGVLAVNAIETWDELDRIRAVLGHDLRLEEVGTGNWQRWDCAADECSAWFKRDWRDGAVSGSARELSCPVEVERALGEAA
jgi:hypothetical protein